MKALRLTLLPLVLILALVSVCDSQPPNCLRRFGPSGEADCGTLTETCTVDSVTGISLNNVPFPSDNRYACYRTCYVNGQDGNCIATESFNERPVNVYATNPNYIAMKFSSPNYHQDNGQIGDYRKSNVCRYHVKCTGDRRLYYAIVGQTMQDTATCSDMAGVCVDRLRMIFPGVGECERCSSMSTPATTNCMDRSGLGNELMVEFTANRERDFPGFEILANCVEPNFDQNNVTNPSLKRQADECTSPAGSGPRPLAPAVPPPADRIQRVLDRDPNAIYIVLEESDFLTYTDGNLRVESPQSGAQEYTDIISLEVENPLGIRRYFRIAPGEFNGLAQLAISDNQAFLVQFGVNPSLLPTEEENTMGALLDTVIANAVSNLERFDVFDDIDLAEQAEEFNFAANASQGTSDTGRSKRGIEPGFINALAVEYGNACNGVLRTSACVYQQVVLGIECTDV